MFNLETSIAQWRQEMLAKGIGSPVPLDELEEHLREEIDRQIQAGTTSQHSFENAVALVGQGDQLKREFTKVRGWSVWLGDNWVARTQRIVGATWLVVCSGYIISAAVIFTWLLLDAHSVEILLGLVIMVIGGAYYGFGLRASIALMRGSKSSFRLLNIYAVLGLIPSGSHTLPHQSSLLSTFILPVFYALSLVSWFLTFVHGRRVANK